MGFGSASNRAVINNIPNKDIISVSSAYTISLRDEGRIINCIANSFSIALPPVSILTVGFACTIWNSSSSSTNIITIDPDADETIDGTDQISLYSGEGISIICDRSKWHVNSDRSTRIYAENSSPSILRPVASGENSIALGYDALKFARSVASGINSFSFAGSASGDYSLALGATASKVGAIAIGSPGYTTKTIANGNYSVAMGGDSIGSKGAVCTSGATGSVALGGSYVSGTSSFAAVNDDASGTYGAKGTTSIAIGKQSLAASASSVAIGLYATSNTIGKYVYSAGRFSTNGDAQCGTYILRCTTTDGSTTTMTTNASTASTNNQVILPNDSTFFFRAHIVGRRSDIDNECAAFIFEGCADRNTAENTVLFVGAPSKQTLARDISSWNSNVVVDTVNGGISFTVVGEANKTIRWVATVQTVEVTG
jgi:hypothetical protein